VSGFSKHLEEITLRKSMGRSQRMEVSATDGGGIGSPRDRNRVGEMGSERGKLPVVPVKSLRPTSREAQ